MESVRVAWRGWLAAHAFLFWALVEWATRAIYWNKEASREALVFNPRKPKDLYDNGYALFAFDIATSAWKGYWRRRDAQPGQPSDEVYELLETQWEYVPFHEVEFSDMPHITFKVRAVSLDWCRKQGIAADMEAAAA